MTQWEPHGLAVGSEMGGKKGCYMLEESRKALKQLSGWKYTENKNSSKPPYIAICI